MSEWPVEVVDYSEVLGGPRSALEPGETVKAARFYIGGEEPTFGGMSIVYPRCGSLGGCPVEGRSTSGTGWRITERDGVLTMNPSIVCGCGGHFWLHDGVLRDA